MIKRVFSAIAACIVVVQASRVLEPKFKLQNRNKFHQIGQPLYKNEIDIYFEPKWTLKKIGELLHYYTSHYFDILRELDLLSEFSLRGLLGKLELPEDTFRSFEEICKGHGFVPETHEIITEDGYILVLHRVYNRSSFVEGSGSTTTAKVQKPIILFNHGIMDSSDGWVINGPKKSPAFVAANAGYDVWLSNTRGNQYSQKHVRLNAKTDRVFWDFSFPENAMFDLPAIIKYIRAKTESAVDNKINIVAHSQGNTEVLYGMVKLPELYRENVNSFIAMSPITRVTQVAPLVEFTVRNIQNFGDVQEMFGIYNIEFYIQKFLMFFCGFFTETCEIGIGFFVSETIKPLDLQRLKVYFGHYPVGTSNKSWVHWAQIYLTKRFQEYDYGEIMNQRIYGQVRPPLLKLDHIKDLNIPTVMLVGKQDTLVYPQDSLWLKDQLGESVKDYIELDGGHLQYFVRSDASYLNVVINYINEFNEIK